jgi:hypothetical protein
VAGGPFLLWDGCKLTNSSKSGRKAVQAAPLFRRKRTYVAFVVASICLLSSALEMWRGTVAQQRQEMVDARINVCQPVTFRPQGALRYRPQVEVAYLVNGESHVVPLSIPEVASSREELNDLLLRYRAGATLRVFYDPARPDDIEVDFASKQRYYLRPLVLLGIGLLCLLFILIVVMRDGRYHCMACGIGVAGRHAFCYNCGAKIPSRKGRMIQ